MNKNKGFTLIELLAVVVLLGIVAVISVPVVKNITNDAKQKGFEKQQNTVLESAKNWAIKNTNLLPETSDFILVKMDTLKKEGFLENKTIINPVDKSEMNGCVEISYDEDFNQYEYEYDDECVIIDGSLSSLATTSTSLDINSINACAKVGIKCNPSTAFAIKVNDTQTYKFYVLADDGNIVTLIMDENVDGSATWSDTADNIYGPNAALNHLNSQTSTWDYVPAIEEYTYDNNLNGTTNEYGYQKFEIKNGVGKLTSQDGNTIIGLQGVSKARMITGQEIDDFRSTNNGSIPTWLSSNLYTSTNTSLPNGYWLLTSTTYYDDTALMNYRGVLYGNVHVTNDGPKGVRPVIELSKIGKIY